MRRSSQLLAARRLPCRQTIHDVEGRALPVVDGTSTERYRPDLCPARPPDMRPDWRPDFRLDLRLDLSLDLRLELRLALGPP